MLKYEQNRCLIGGGDAILLKIWSDFSSLQYIKVTRRAQEIVSLIGGCNRFLSGTFERVSLHPQGFSHHIKKK